MGLRGPLELSVRTAVMQALEVPGGKRRFRWW